MCSNKLLAKATENSKVGRAINAKLDMFGTREATKAAVTRLERTSPSPRVVLAVAFVTPFVPPSPSQVTINAKAPWKDMERDTEADSDLFYPMPATPTVRDDWRWEYEDTIESHSVSPPLFPFSSPPSPLNTPLLAQPAGRARRCCARCTRTSSASTREPRPRATYLAARSDKAGGRPTRWRTNKARRGAANRGGARRAATHNWFARAADAVPAGEVGTYTLVGCGRGEWHPNRSQGLPRSVDCGWPG